MFYALYERLMVLRNVLSQWQCRGGGDATDLFRTHGEWRVKGIAKKLFT